MTANTPHRSNAMETGSLKPAARSNGQLFTTIDRGVAVKSGQRVPTSKRDISPRSKPEDETSEEEDGTDSESGFDGEEDTIVSEEIQAEQIALQSDAVQNPKPSASGKPFASTQDGKDLSAAAPPALLDEIRKMIHDERRYTLCYRRGEDRID
jgi:hypothetical protein